MLIIRGELESRTEAETKVKKLNGQVFGENKGKVEVLKLWVS